THILGRLEDRADRRVDFIHRVLSQLQEDLARRGSTLRVEHGAPMEVWKRLLDEYDIAAVTVNHDHEPYALARDEAIAGLLKERGVALRSFKDISIVERGEIVKDNGEPYTVYAPYMRKWWAAFDEGMPKAYPSEEHLGNLLPNSPMPIPSL